LAFDRDALDGCTRKRRLGDVAPEEETAAKVAALLD
jgi:hypothetical protein